MVPGNCTAAVTAAWLKPALGCLAQQRQPLLFGGISPRPIQSNSGMSLPGPSHEEEWSCAATSLTEARFAHMPQLQAVGYIESVGMFWGNSFGYYFAAAL